MTLADIVAAIRDEIGEPIEGYWKDSQLKRYINDGLRDLNGIARVIGTATLNYVAGDYSENLPADFLESWVVKWSGNTKRFLTDLKSGAIPNTTKGEPIGYIVTPTTLDIWYVPANDGTITLLYFKKLPSLVNDTDVPIIDERWHTLLVYYGASLAKQFAGEPEGPLFMSQYINGKAQFAQERMQATLLLMGTPNILDAPDIEWPWPFNTL